MSQEYYITLNGKRIPVMRKYTTLSSAGHGGERKRRQVRAENELSLDALADAGFELPDEASLVDEIVADKLLLDMLLEALSDLTDDERFLIDALFYQEKSERMVAKETGLSKTGIHKQKEKILSKLRDLLKIR